ncbi:protein FAM243-like [Callorhinchus milii]|uniref:protein FAM243-like n=1 Tax=Callorhinchus milii TaxID=7868 RepID=UPI0004574840|nr:protein FAM243-like [Callorhinchus milii]|eukprot:gi/632936135/ref/XP_007892512.1/ PREDICTED: uncharacterized protein C21orf140 homolog [Callorhinchus milii]
MRIFINLLRAKVCVSDVISPGRRQCLQYIRTLRALQSEGLYTVYLGETPLPESLLIGDVSPQPASSRGPAEQGLMLVHAGGMRGWVPWNYRVFFGCQELWPVPETVGNAGERLFPEFCHALRSSYGRCAVVVRTNQRLPSLGTKRNHLATASLELPQHPPGDGQGCPPQPTPTITYCPQIANSYGHQLLWLPSHHPHLSPLEAAWATLKWTIINNRKQFTISAVPTVTGYRCINVKALMEAAVEAVSHSKWRLSISRVKRWENHYLQQEA